MTNKIRQIARLLEAIKARELSSLAAIKTPRVRIEDLIEENRQEILQLQVPIPVASWPLWELADRRLRCLMARNQQLNTELASIAAEMEKQQLQTAMAVGKHDAFDRSCITNLPVHRYQA